VKKILALLAVFIFVFSGRVSAIPESNQHGAVSGSSGNASSAIVDEIRIFYHDITITFQKGDIALPVDLEYIMTQYHNPVTFQYINSSLNNGYYYFMFLGIQPFGKPPYGTGLCGACFMDAAIIVKISEDFTEYEVSSQYTSEVGQRISSFTELEFLFFQGMFKLDGTIFHWLVAGEQLWGDNLEKRMIISVDASRLEDGFIIEEFPTNDLLVEHWLKHTRGTVIDEENNNGSFILFGNYQ
jgi:hypothetical protein